MAFAGLDVGTSGSKMLVYDLDGNVIFTASRKYNELGGDGRRELDPETVMKYVKEVLREVGENCPEKIDAMAVTSLGESVVHGEAPHNDAFHLPDVPLPPAYSAPARSRR